VVHTVKSSHLRIISGKYKGRRLHPPGSLPVRPTTDFAKEGLFNVLNRLVDYDEIRVADLFAGTGAISFEFCSRGAASVMAVDIERHCVDFINRTAVDFGMEELKAIRSNVLVFLRRSVERFDVIFADPPYDMSGIEKLPALVSGSGILRDGGLFILEHSDRYDFQNETGFLEVRNYGRVHFTIFRMGKTPGED
jgi:16S rRNA (guanine966-N2)-methyltransferase